MSGLPTPGKYIDDNKKNIFKNGFYQLISDIGRNVIVYLPPIVENCPNCLYDGIRKRSKSVYNINNPNPNGHHNKNFPNGSTCPVCGGKGKLETPQTSTQRAIISNQGKDIEILKNEIGNSSAVIAKTTMHIEALKYIEASSAAKIDGHLYTRLQSPKKSGLGEAFLVKAYWIME